LYTYIYDEYNKYKISWIVVTILQARSQ